jgi:nucleoside-diphosphate-sugar epimerase
MINKKTILITGASGNLGEKLRQHLQGKYILKLIDIDPKDDEIFWADLSLWNKNWVELFQGVDTVVHFAADSNDRQNWQNLIKPNIDASINVFTASAQAGVKRVIYSSASHVMGGYRFSLKDKKITTDLPVLPGTHYYTADLCQCDSTPYAATKLFGERLGKCFSDIYGISFIGIRIGLICQGSNKAEDLPVREDQWFSLMWLSNRDFCHLLDRCIEADQTIRFAIINGMSANKGMRWDIQNTKELTGFEPIDDVTQREI